MGERGIRVGSKGKGLRGWWILLGLLESLSVSRTES